MSGDGYWTETRLAGMLIVAGCAAAFTGGGMGASLGAWSAGSTERLYEIVNANRGAWRALNLLWVVGVPLVAVGVAAAARAFGDGPLARAGVALWLVGGALGAISFALQGEVPLAASARWAEAGTVPDWSVLETRVGATLMVVFMALALLGTALLGVAGVRSPGVPDGYGWGALGAAALMTPLVFAAIPAGALLPALVFAAWALAP